MTQLHERFLGGKIKEDWRCLPWRDAGGRSGYIPRAHGALRADPERDRIVVRIAAVSLMAPLVR
jgi:hypothetical protein